MNRQVIIVAGGTGLRMGTELPKQFLPLKEKPVIVHSIQKFQAALQDISITVVMNPNWLEFFADMLEQWSMDRIQTVPGGETRFHSVKNGLDRISATDGMGNAIPAVSSKSSLREITVDGNKAVDRSKFKLVQTPQCFDLKLLKSAYETNFDDSFTDDASVFEKAGHMIHLIEGEYDNFKITRSLDLRIAEELI